MKSFALPLLLALAAAAQPAQSQNNLTTNLRIDPHAVTMDVRIVGPVHGTALLLVSFQPFVHGLPTPWGLLRINPNGATSFPVPLGATGSAAIKVVMPRPYPDWQLYMQALVADQALVNVKLGNPAAIAVSSPLAPAAAGGLEVNNGTYKATVTAKKGAKVEVKKVSGKTTTVLGWGIVDDSGVIVLSGSTQGELLGDEIEVWVDPDGPGVEPPSLPAVKTTSVKC